MRNLIVLMIGITALLYSCQHHEEHHQETSSFLVTNPIVKDTLIHTEYVCQIHAHQHIELRVLEKGYLEKIMVDEGEFVRKGQLLFQIQPTIYQSESQIAQSEVNIAEIEYNNIKALADSNVVSQNELALASAKLIQAKAELSLAQAHLKFTEIRAPFDGYMGKFEDVRLGSLLDEGELLTTLSDNSKMWVYFNVPESQYLDYTIAHENDEAPRVALRLANNKMYDQDGIIETIAADFNNTTGNISFRATFSNKTALLRHGQTGTILWPHPLENALIIPQKATFEILDKKFVYLVTQDGTVKSREITIAAELNHLFVVSNGLDKNDQILLDGLRKVQNNDVISFEFQEPDQVYSQLNLHAE